MRTLLTAAAMSSALGACTQIDNMFYGNREGTVEYPGSGAGPNATTTYIVKDRDTVDGLAQRFGVATQAIVDRNGLSAPYTLRSGQTLKIPGAKPETAPQEGGAGRSEVTVRSNLPPPGTGDPPRSAAPGQPTPLSPVATAPTGPLPKLDWPLQGKVIGSYGPKAGGQKNDGIDIQADKGAAVKAADGGIVVYAGSKVRGMGNLLLVDHSNGYITAYAHNESLLVKEGDEVKRGQTIARVGNSGGVSDPRLHFEVRRGNRTIDPITVLPAL